MTNAKSKLYRAALVVAALAVGSVAVAGPSPAHVGVRKALTKAEQGPDELRRFIQRTRMIYALDYTEIMSMHEAAKAASARPPADVARVSPR